MKGSEAFYLHGTHERHCYIHSLIMGTGRDEGYRPEYGKFKHQNNLPPVYDCLMPEFPFHKLRYENSGHECQNRPGVSAKLFPVSVCDIDAQQHDISRLRIRENAAPADIGIYIQISPRYGKQYAYEIRFGCLFP